MITGFAFTRSSSPPLHRKTGCDVRPASSFVSSFLIRISQFKIISVILDRYMMKLRHGKNFGSYPGTCWRLLFTFALMPWMRKYRLSSGSTEVSSFRFAAMRMWTGRMPTSVSHDVSASNNIANGESDDKETDPKVINDALRKEVLRLQIENDMLRHAVYQRGNFTEAKSRRPEHFSRSTNF